MQLTAINLKFKLNVNLRFVKFDFMQSTAVNLEFKLKVIFKLLSCNRPYMYNLSTLKLYIGLIHVYNSMQNLISTCSRNVDRLIIGISRLPAVSATDRQMAPGAYVIAVGHGRPLI